MQDENKSKEELIIELNQYRQQQKILQDEINHLRQDSSSNLQAQYLVALHNTTLGLIKRLDLNELLENIIEQAAQLLGTSHGFICLRIPDETEIEMQLGVGLYAEMLGFRMKPGEGMSGKIWVTGEPMVIEDYDSWSGRASQHGYSLVRACIGVPLIHTDSDGKAEIIGILGMASERNSTLVFDETAVELLNRFGQLASVAIDNAYMFQEMRHSIDELQQAQQDAELANKAKSAFLATVSHELRTPLTSVLGFAKIIQKRLNERILPHVEKSDRKTERAVQQVEKNLEIILIEGERLTTLINDVLNLTKIESGRFDWHMQPVSIAEIVNRATASVAPLFGQKRLKLVQELPDDLPQVMGDKDRLIQVVVNILSNAVKFTDEGGVICRVNQTNDELVVSIIDTGMGIENDDLPTVFEKFKQLNDTLTDKPTGTGLGLPICKKIVEHHRGRIWVESEYGRGTTIFFTLPIL